MVATRENADAAGAEATQEVQALRREVERLREVVAGLEQQLEETERWGSQTVASAQESIYWLERWGVDFNAMMSRRGAEHARRIFRGIRAVYRVGLRIKRRLTS